MTSTEEIDNTIIRPGSVRINVKGAFIVDNGGATPAPGNGISSGASNGGNGSPTQHETRDIRLPNHTAVVSHIAVDVRYPPTLSIPLPASARVALTMMVCVPRLVDH